MTIGQGNGSAVRVHFDPRSASPPLRENSNSSVQVQVPAPKSGNEGGMPRKLDDNKYRDPSLESVLELDDTGKKFQANDIYAKYLDKLQAGMDQLFVRVKELSDELAQSNQARSSRPTTEFESTQPRQSQRQFQPQPERESQNQMPGQNHVQNGFQPLNGSAFQMPIQNWFSPNPRVPPYFPPGFGNLNMPAGFNQPFDPRAGQSFNPHLAAHSGHDSKSRSPDHQDGNRSRRGMHSHGREAADARNSHYQPYGYGYTPPYQSAYPYAQSMGYPYAQPMGYSGAFGSNRMGFMSGLGIGGILGSSISSLALLCFLI